MTQFDATARINVDLSAFTRAAAQGGAATNAFNTAVRRLGESLGQVRTLDKARAAELSRSIAVQQKLASAVNQYASAVDRLGKSQVSAGDASKKFNAALDGLRQGLSRVGGLSKEEAERLSRSVSLYQRLAQAVNAYVSAIQRMVSITQRNIQLHQQQTRETNRAAEAAQRAAAQQAALAQRAQALALQQQRMVMQQQRLADQQRRLAAGGTAVGSAFDHVNNSTFALRSTLGELEGAFRQILQVLTAIPGAALSAAISQEAAFAQVSRVVSEAEAEAHGLLRGLQALSTELPISFEATARIAQLGAQIGITADQLIEFTRVVAAFSITTGISEEQVTLLLGRIAKMSDVPVNEYENLASTVLKLGTASAATETEILRVNEAIATVSNVFGLTTEATTGLASALSTLRVRPELSRGSLTRVFGQLQDAVDGSGQALKALAAVMGLTAQEVKDLRATDPDAFFLRFVEGLQNAEKQGLSFRTVLRELGIGAVRDIDTVSRLANNYDVLSDSVNMAYAEYAKGTELQRQSHGIYDTTKARLGNLVDAFKNFLANAGKPLAGLVSVLAEATVNILEFVNAVPASAMVLGTLATGAAVVGAAFLTYRLAMIKALTTVVALREAQTQLAGRTINASTVLSIYRQSQAAAAVATANTARATAQQTAAMNAQAAVAARTSTAMFANVVATRNAGTAQAAYTVQNFRGSAAAFANVAATTAQTNATNRAAAAARTSTVAMAGWAGGIGLVITAAALLIPPLLNTKTRTEEIADAARQAAGGVGELARAIEEDTKAAANGVEPYRRLTVGIEDHSDATVTAAKRAIALAEAEKEAITTVHGSVRELERRASSQDRGAKSAKAYLAQIANANKTIESNTKLLGDNTVAISDAARKWAESAFDAAIMESGLIKATEAAEGLDSTLVQPERALRRLRSTGIDISSVLDTALRNPVRASKELDAAITELNKTVEKGEVGWTGTSQATAKARDEAIVAKRFLESLKLVVGDLGDTAAATAVKKQLLGDQLEKTPLQTELAKKGFGEVAASLKSLGEGSQEADAQIEAMMGTLQGFGTPLDAWRTAFEAAMGGVKGSTDEASSALTAFSSSSAVSFDAYLAELDKIIAAQRNWSQNIVILASRLGPDIAQQLANMGPEAAPMIQRFVDATDAEIKKLKPRLEVSTDASMKAMAAVIKNSIPIVSQASTNTARVISEALVRQLEEGKVPFSETLNQYTLLVEALNKVKGKPKVELDDEDAKKDLETLRGLISGANNDGSLDPKGWADIDLDAAEKAIEKLKKDILAEEGSGSFDPDGVAEVDPSSFYGDMGKLRDDIRSRERSRWFDPDGRPKLDTDLFYDQLAGLRRSSNETGSTIQTNLTRRATVTVGYTFVRNNQPPTIPRHLQTAADGGWVNGPGGPRDDRVPMMLSNKEFVVNAASAKRYAPLLEAINSYRGGGGKQLDTTVERVQPPLVPRLRPAPPVPVPERARALAADRPAAGPRTVITIHNTYPQAEPTSKTVNRALAMAAALDGTT